MIRYQNHILAISYTQTHAPTIDGSEIPFPTTDLDAAKTPSVNNGISTTNLNSQGTKLPK